MSNLVLSQVRAFDPLVHSIQAGLTTAPHNDVSIKTRLEQSISKLADLAATVDEIRNCALKQLRDVNQSFVINETSVSSFYHTVTPLDEAFSSLKTKNPDLQTLESALSDLKASLSRRSTTDTIAFLEQTYPISQVLHRQLETLQKCQYNYSSPASNVVPAESVPLQPQAPAVPNSIPSPPPSRRASSEALNSSRSQSGSAISISTESDNSSVSFAIEPTPVDRTYQAAMALKLRFGLVSNSVIPKQVQKPISVKSTAPEKQFPFPSKDLMFAFKTNQLRLGQVANPPKNLSYLTQLRTNEKPAIAPKQPTSTSSSSTRLWPYAAFAIPPALYLINRK